MNQRDPRELFGAAGHHLRNSTRLAALVMAVLLLAACDSPGAEQPVVDSGVDNDAVVATTMPEEEETAVVDEELTEEVEDAAAEDTTASGDIEGDATIITSTELITGTEVTTDVTVTTDTVVLEQQLITTVITATDMVTDVAETSDTATETETEVITETAELTDETTTGAVEGNVDVTPVAPTATPRAQQTPEAEEEASTRTMTDTDTAVIVAFIGIEGATGRSVRASTLLDADFETLDGEVGGEIQDLVINMQTGQVVYVLLEYGGILDVGDTDMPVPLSAFTWGSEDELILNVDGEQLENYPGVSNDWPVPDENDWDLDVRGFWEGIGYDPGYDSEAAATGIRRASDILSDPLADAGYGEGSVEDLIISLEEGRATYVLTSLAGAGLAEDWYVIPFSAFDPSAPDDGLYLNPNFDATLLEQAPTFDEGIFGDTSVYDQDYDQEWRSFWDDAGWSLDMNNNE